MRDLCFLDVETTGTRFGYHEIIEIAAIRTSPDAAIVRGTWQARVLPRHPERITDTARALNGFTIDGWSGARASDAALWQEFSNFGAGCTPVCHNPSFDRAFITLAAAEAGVAELALDYHWVGTESIAWPLYAKGCVPRLSLSSLCEVLQVGCESVPHTALGGAEACRRLYTRLMAILAGEILASSVAAQAF